MKLFKKKNFNPNIKKFVGATKCPVLWENCPIIKSTEIKNSNNKRTLKYSTE